MVVYGVAFAAATCLHERLVVGHSLEASHVASIDMVAAVWLQKRQRGAVDQYVGSMVGKPVVFAQGADAATCQRSIDVSAVAKRVFVYLAISDLLDIPELIEGRSLPKEQEASL